ncbi:type VII secretion system-associated protein [Streptomyces sp. TRM 70361]|uniref:type VII secretion system-associated protein n=1 Tax=Streptomyces sp. TRM 70361 TaxID=3116553 RepID=UPI002E7C4A5C|nr:type VII secretion system-associated protein [Streptomyces sp. TRM 70361]MEE1940110.1 type VII secretion system-associated protein [Streptomyces sp. TRM 70361]
MAENKTTVLDSEFLKNFINEEIVEFKAALGKMLKDSPDGQAISSVGDPEVTTLKSTRPLVIGQMAGENGVGGSALNEQIQEAADAIHRVIKDHRMLFDDIEEALEETVEELTKNQKGSLDKITAETFMDIFDDVDAGMEGGGTYSGGDDDDDDDD